MKRLASGVAAVAFLAFAAFQVHAFVNDTTDIELREDVTEITERIAELADGLDSDGVASDQALEQIDLAIDEVDSLLDTEPANETELLDLRDTLVQMRSQLIEQAPESVEELAHTPVLDSIFGGQGASVGGGGFVPLTGTGGGGFSLGGGGFSLGGGGGGGLGGFLTSPLGLAAIGGGVAAIAASSDDDADQNSM